MHSKIEFRSIRLTIVLALAVVGLAVPQFGNAQAAHFGGVVSTFLNSTSSTEGIAIDGNGAIYTLAYESVLISRPSAQGFTDSTIPAPYAANGIAVDAAGNLYITVDNASGPTVVKETWNPATESYTQSALFQPSGNSAMLTQPAGVAVDASGNILVLDRGTGGGNGSGSIYKIPAGGGAPVPFLAACGNSCAAGQGLADPFGIAFDTNWNLFIADTNNERIVEDVAVMVGGVATYPNPLVQVATFGYYSPDAVNSQIAYPAGIAIDRAGNLFIASGTANAVVRETLANGRYQGAWVANSGLNYPHWLAVDAHDNVYISDENNDRVVVADWSSASFGSQNIGTTSAALSLLFVFDKGGVLGPVSALTQGVAGLDFAVASGGTCQAGSTYATGANCTVNVTFTPSYSGARNGAAVLENAAGQPIVTVYISGTGLGAQMAFLPGTETVIASGNNLSANGPAIDPRGNIYYADFNNNKVVRLTPGANGYASTVVRSGLNQPSAVAIDGSGNVYIADSGNSRVLKETLTGGGFVESALPTVNLSYPTGLAVDGAGNVYIADTTNDRVVIENLSNGSYTQTQTGTGLIYPYDLAVDAAGNIFVADTLNSRIVKETPTASGYQQTTIESNVAVPYEVAVDGNGNVYVADTFNRRVVRETPANGSYKQSVVGTRGLGLVYGIGIDQAGNLYVGDGVNNIFLKEDVADAPALKFAPTAPGSISADSPRMVTIVNNGNEPLVVEPLVATSNPWISQNFTLASSGANECAILPAGGNAESLAAGSACALAVSFAPTGKGSNSGALVAVDNNLNAAGPKYAIQTITLNGALLYDAAVTLNLAASTVTYPGATNVTACVASAVQGTVATGTVAIVDNGTQLANLTLGGDGCAYWYIAPGLNAGAHSIAANYGGDSNNVAGNSAPVALTVNPVAVNLAASCGPTTVTSGFNYHCTVTASSNAGAPVGQITYALDGGVAATATLANGNATLAVPQAATGNHQLTIGFALQGNFGAATPVVKSFTVNEAAVNVVLTPTPWWATAGSSFSFSAQVNATRGGAAMTAGTVSFTDGANPLGQVNLNGQGKATFATTGLKGGSHTITATYSGAGTYSAGAASVTITVGAAATTTKLTAATTALTVGQPAVLTATVTGVNPTGNVVFVSAGSTLCTAALANGVATCQMTPTVIGHLSVTANYQGDASNQGSSSYLGFTVSDPTRAAVSLTAATDTLTYPAGTNLTACVTSVSKKPATGSMRIMDGSSLLTTQTLGGDGCAYWYISTALNTGTHSLTANYLGDTMNPAGTSPAVTILVNAAPVSLTASCWNATIPYGVSYHCTVSASSGAGSPQGNVTYVLDNQPGQSVALANGNASFTVTQPAAGTHQVAIYYAAQGNFSDAGPVNESFAVTAAPVRMTLTASENPAKMGDAVIFTATISSGTAGAPANTGTVTFVLGTNTATVQVDGNGKASWTTTALAAGLNTVNAAYSGGPNYGNASGSVAVWAIQ